MSHTPSDVTIPPTLARSWSERGVELEGLDRSPFQTTLRTAELPPADADSGPSLSQDHDVELGEILGQGGMGVVHEARQRSLGREVAVKRLREPGTGDAAERRLLLEARVTGGLEHPNVVPIHLLGRDAAGQPLIVMKRVEGRAWSDLLAERTAEQRLKEDALRRHLTIFVAVARAAHFAHTRGVLHRDIKPANVMVGSFGEVYLVDWGLAVGLEGRATAVPLASSVRSIEGTPVYMAPEMASGDGTLLDARTDVYLLGATLHEIVAGHPPHAAATLGASVVRAFQSEPPADVPGAPRTLWQIVRKALARERDARFTTASELADAVESFVTRRGSHLLAEVAVARAAELDRAGAATEPATQALRVTFHEARFAFEQSLAHWPENAEARRGLRAAITTMIGLELRANAPEVALALLPLLDPPDPVIDAEVEAAVERSRSRARALEAAAHDADLAVGARGRRALTYLAALTWGASLLAVGALTRSGVLPVDHVGFALVNAGFFVGTAIAMGLSREIVLANAASRRVASTTLLVFSAGVILWPLFERVGLDMAESTVVGAIVSALLWTSAVLSLGAPWVPMVIGQTLVAIGAWLWPAWHFEIFGVLGALQTAIAGTLMSDYEAAPRRERGPNA